MFGTHPEKFPFIDIKTANGWRVVIGPCAVRLILTVVYMGLVVGSLILIGPSFGKEVVALLRAVGV
jgi:hypothetical protein